MRNLLGNTKDQQNKFTKSGIYQFNCSARNCNATYIGQTKRSVQIRTKEHMKHIEKLEPAKSAIAEHSINNRHKVKIDDFKLIEETNDHRKLNILESIHIHKNQQNAINRETGFVSSALFNIL